MKELDRLKELIEDKRKNIKTEDDKEKLEIIDELMKNDNCFFNLNVETAFGILDFLGVRQEEALGLYNGLISPENYMQNTPKQVYYQENNKTK